MRHVKSILATMMVALPLFVWGVSSGSTVAAQQAAPVAQADPTAGMPDGPGKDITIKTCTKCHSITNITGAHKDADGWTATITKMVGYGATGSDDDFQAILDYLTKNYGLTPPPPAASGSAHSKVVVNKETGVQLALDLGLTHDEAKALVSYRAKVGGFKTVAEMKKVVDPRKIDARAADMIFS